MDFDLAPPSEIEAVRLDQKTYLFPCVKPLYEKPLVLTEGRGSEVFDASGNAYLDFFSGILSTSIGHCHPLVVERVREQAGRLGHTSTLYITENQINVAKQLAALSPGGLTASMFLTSGTAAVEAAVMLARLYTGREEIVALRHSYSGSSILASNLTGHAAWRPLSNSVTGITHALAPYPYRSPFGEDPELNAERFAQDIEEVILTTTNGRPAALLVETIQGVGGFIVPPPGYFQRAAEIIRKYGGLFICDEVQTGFGRTGRRWFGIEHWDVEPDIMVTAKGIASGYPVGAVTTRPDIATEWKRKTISTFGGNPVCMAAAEATLEVMVAENIPRLAEQRGHQLRKGLEQLSQTYNWIGEVRGMGLMQAMELVVDREDKKPDPARAQKLLHHAQKAGLLIGLGGLHGHVIRIGPSMLISEKEMADGLGRLEDACRWTEKEISF